MQLRHRSSSYFDLTIEQSDFIQVFYQYRGVNAPLEGKGLIAFGIGVITLPTGHIVLKLSLPDSYYVDDNGYLYFLDDQNGASELTIKSDGHDLKLHRVDQGS